MEAFSLIETLARLTESFALKPVKNFQSLSDITKFLAKFAGVLYFDRTALF